MAMPAIDGAQHRRRFRAARMAVLAARLLCVALFAAPMLFMFVSSLKPDTDIFKDIGSVRAFLPVGDISLRNYAGVFETVPAARFLLNSLFVSLVTVALGVVVNSLAAFALSRLAWPGRRLALSIVIATLVVPFETFALPLVWWVNKLPWLTMHGLQLAMSEGWLDTYRVQIVPFVANAFSIYLFYSYFQSIPRELDEAARIDGAGWFRIYRTVVMPLSGPAVATVSILTFLPAWNSYLWPLMVVQTQELRPVMVGVSYFFQLKVHWGEIMAYSTLITLPVLVLFLAFQRAFVNSIASTGVKG